MITELTDELLASATREELRTWATELNLYSRNRDVFHVEITSEVVNRAGTLTLIDQLVNALAEAHADLDAEIKNEYGRFISVTVWATDESLRESVKHARNRKIKEAAGTE